MRVLLLFIGLILLVGVASAGTGDFGYSKVITLNQTMVNQSIGTGHYPLLVSQSSDANLSARCQADGDDIVFYNAANTTQLPHEMELWNSTTGEHVHWMDIEDIKNVSTVTMWYGNATIANSENASGVWDINYTMVQHLQETDIDGGAGDIKDSTSNAHDGTTVSMDTASQVSGQIDGSFIYDGIADYMTVDSVNNSIDLSQPWMTSAWFNTTDLNNFCSAIGFDADTGQESLAVGNDDSGKLKIMSDGKTLGSGTSLVSGALYKADLTWNGTGASVYLNGIFDYGVTPSSAIDWDEIDTFRVGALASTGYTNFISGITDEIRISDIERTAAYINTDYNNSKYPSLFISVGAEQSSGPDITAPSVTNLADSPDPQGYGENVTISATITDAGGVHTALIGITPPGGSETNYTMTNSGSTYSYNYIGWDNGSHSYKIHANDSAGNMNDSETGTFVLTSNTYVHIKTLKDTYRAGEYVNITDPAVIPGVNENWYGLDTPAGSGRHLGTPATTVYKVTNLNDAGAGSLRYGLSSSVSSPKVIVFEVSGIIELNSYIRIGSGAWDSLADAEAWGSYITIAGQTAPYPGITINGSYLKIERNCHDILIQHMRFRFGDEGRSLGDPDFETWDCMIIDSHYRETETTWTPAYNIVIDHCSFSWGIDEAIEAGGNNMSFINNIVSEALNSELHDKGPHSKGFFGQTLVPGKSNNYLFFANNLMSHNVDRNPWIKGGTPVIIANNVVYDHKWAVYVSDHGGSGPIVTSIAGNYIKETSTTEQNSMYVVGGICANTRIYMANGTDHVSNYWDSQYQTDPWNASGYFRNCYNWTPCTNPVPEVNRAYTAPYWPENYTAMNASDAKTYVLNNAGAWSGNRDVVDTRVINQTRNELCASGCIITNIYYSNADCTAANTPHPCCTGSGTGDCVQNAEGGFPPLAENTRSLTVPANPDVVQASGYTNLEEWLHTYLADAEPSAAPTRSAGAPSGAQSAGTTSLNISLTTSINASCRFMNDTGNVNFTNMTNNFTSTGLLSHETTVSGLSDGNSYIYCVRCNSTAGDMNDDDYNITFSISNAANTMSTWDSTDGTLVNTSETAYFYVNYTNASGPINASGDYVNISFADAVGGPFAGNLSMVYNASTEWYEYNRSWTTAGQYYYEVNTYQNSILGDTEVNYIDIDYQSRIYNKQTDNPITAHVLMKVEYYNITTSSWVLEETIYNASQQITTETNLKLDDLFNGSWHTTDNASNGDGTYRVYVAYTDPYGTVLVNSDGSFMNDSYNFTIDIITPPASITNLTNTTGNFWHNWTWTNPTDADFNYSYILMDNVWTVNSSLEHHNLSASPHNTSNISVKTVDTNGNMNTTWVNHSSTIPNNPITISGISASYSVDEGDTLSIDANYTDADSDSPTFTDNASDWTVNSSTGVVSWITANGDDGTYNYYIKVDDGYGSTDQTDFTVTVNNTLRPTYYVDQSHVNASDGTNGTEDYPWETFGNLNNLNCPVSQGDTVYVKTGTYNAPLHSIKAGTADNYITFKVYGTDEVLIDGSYNVTNWNVHSGNIYNASWNSTWLNATWYDISGENGYVVVDYTYDADHYLRPESNISNMTAGSWHYNDTIDMLYVWLSDSTNPDDHTISSTKSYAKSANGIYVNSGGAVNGTSYLKFEGFKVRLCGSGLKVDSPDHHIEFTDIESYGHSNGIRLERGASNITMENLNIHHNTGPGIQLNANYSSINNSSIHHSGIVNWTRWGSPGVILMGPYNTISNSSVYNNGFAGDYGPGIYFETWGTDGAGGPDRSHHNVAEYNNISNPGQTGIEIAGGDNNTIRYNLITDNSEGIALYQGGTGGSMTPAQKKTEFNKIYNNVIDNSSYLGIRLYTNTHNTTAKNNIVINSDSFHIRMKNISVGHILDNNLYYDSGGFMIAGVWGYNFTEYKSITGQGANSMESNPIFVNLTANNFRLQSSSPAINNGTDVGLTTDYIGNPIVGIPDIGAYEYQPAVNTSTITLPANSQGMINNWTTATTFSAIAANELNDVVYSYYNVTSGLYESYYPGYSWNANAPIGRDNSVIVFVDAQTTVTADIVTPSSTELYVGWNMLYVQGSDNETIADIKADIGANCTDVFWFNSSAGDWSNTTSDTIQPNQGFTAYINTPFTWTRSDL